MCQRWMIGPVFMEQRKEILLLTTEKTLSFVYPIAQKHNSIKKLGNYLGTMPSNPKLMEPNAKHSVILIINYDTWACYYVMQVSTAQTKMHASDKTKPWEPRRKTQFQLFI